MIQEVLEFFIVILLEPEIFSGIDDVAQILDKCATFRAQLLAGVGKHVGFNSASESDIDLLVCGKLSYKISSEIREMRIPFENALEIP